MAETAKRKANEQLGQIGSIVRNVVEELIKQTEKECEQRIEKGKKTRDDIVNGLRWLIQKNTERNEREKKTNEQREQTITQTRNDEDLMLLEQNMRQLHEWTKTQQGEIIYDSNVNEFNNSEFNTRCIGKEKIAIVGFNRAWRCFLWLL